MKKIEGLRRGYVVSIGFLAVLIVCTPALVRTGFSFISEEFLEGMIIFVLLLLGIVIDFVYEREMRQQDKMLREAWQHIGAVNLLVERLRMVLADDIEYPRSKKELKTFAGAMLEKARGLVSCDGILLRMVETGTGKTLFEFGGAENIKNIGNKDLIGGVKMADMTVLHSLSNKVGVKAFLVVPCVFSDEDKMIALQKIVNDFTAVFVISRYLL